MKPDTLLIRGSLVLIVLAVAAWLWPRLAPGEPSTPGMLAANIERFTWNTLAAPFPTGRCETAQHLTFAREPGAPIADHWYVSSQVLADVALARVTKGSTFHLDCAIERSFRYLELLWVEAPPGGYAPRSDLNGSNATTQDIYADDNALAGLGMLEAASYVSDPTLRFRMELGAERAALFLIDSGLWDDAYGGGFWWNTQRERSDGGKPVQTAGLAVQLFVGLFRLTGDEAYREWAEIAMRWCDELLFDERMGLYRFGFRAELPDLPPHPSYVNYDQAIMISAHLAMLEMGDARLDHLARARMLAEQLERFRSPLGGYVFELGVPQVFSHYSAWSSLGLLDLYEVDRDPRWLNQARESLRNLNMAMMDPADFGMYHGAYECIPRWISSCPEGANSAVDRRKLHLSQSWTQRALARLEQAQRLE